MPTPTSETSLTEIEAFELAFSDRELAGAKSSINHKIVVGGGEIKPTPGTEWRQKPMYSTLYAQVS